MAGLSGDDPDTLRANAQLYLRDPEAGLFAHKTPFEAAMEYARIAHSAGRVPPPIPPDTSNLLLPKAGRLPSSVLRIRPIWPANSASTAASDPCADINNILFGLVSSIQECDADTHDAIMECVRKGNLNATVDANYINGHMLPSKCSLILVAHLVDTEMVRENELLEFNRQNVRPTEEEVNEAVVEFVQSSPDTEPILSADIYGLMLVQYGWHCIHVPADHLRARVPFYCAKCGPDVEGDPKLDHQFWSVSVIVAAKNAKLGLTGVGSMLMDAVEGLARMCGANYMTLDSLTSPATVGFYVNRGWLFTMDVVGASLPVDPDHASPDEIAYDNIVIKTFYERVRSGAMVTDEDVWKVIEILEELGMVGKHHYTNARILGMAKQHKILRANAKLPRRRVCAKSNGIYMMLFLANADLRRVTSRRGGGGGGGTGSATGLPAYPSAPPPQWVRPLPPPPTVAPPAGPPRPPAPKAPRSAAAAAPTQFTSARGKFQVPSGMVFTPASSAPPQAPPTPPSPSTPPTPRGPMPPKVPAAHHAVPTLGRALSVGPGTPPLPRAVEVPPPDLTRLRRGRPLRPPGAVARRQMLKGVVKIMPTRLPDPSSSRARSPTRAASGRSRARSRTPPAMRRSATKGTA